VHRSLVELATGVTMARCPKDVHASRLTPTCTEGLSFMPVLLPPPASAATAPVSRGPRPSATPTWKRASFSQYERLGETVMGYTARVAGYRYTE
jgi:hypothetical protein